MDKEDFPLGAHVIRSDNWPLQRYSVPGVTVGPLFLRRSYMRESGLPGCGLGVRLTTSRDKQTVFENLPGGNFRRIIEQPTGFWREGFKIGHMECVVTLWSGWNKNSA